VIEMKKLLFGALILFMFTNLYSQQFNNIYMKNGDSVIGIILKSNSEDSVKVKLNDGKIIYYKSTEISKIEQISIYKFGSIGAGFGIPYGVLGINIEISIIDNLNITAGLGSVILNQGIGYNFGLKYYFDSFNEKTRFRISAYYGVNTVKESSLNKTYNGFTFGLGQRCMFGYTRAHGFDMDLLAVVTSGYSGTVKNMGFGPFKLSIGYRYGF
jgi:hypothetical protein